MDPSSIPDGIVIVSVFRLFSTPSLWHVLHGVSGTSPSPSHVGHAVLVCTTPKIVRWVETRIPLPPHVSHFFMRVPGSAPIPAQRAHTFVLVSVTSRSVPNTASEKPTSMSTRTSCPCSRACRPRPPLNPNKSPNKSPRYSNPPPF